MAGSNHYFYLNSSNLADATKVYADIAGTILGPAGYYGNNVIYRYWNGSQFTNTGECIDSTPPPTLAPVTPSPTPSPVTPSPTPSPVTPPPTPSPVAPSPVTPPPTPSPVTPAPTSSGICRFVFVPNTVSTTDKGLDYVLNGNITLTRFSLLISTPTTYGGVTGEVYAVCSDSYPMWYDFNGGGAMTDPAGVQRPPNGGSCTSNNNCSYSPPPTPAPSTPAPSTIQTYIVENSTGTQYERISTSGVSPNDHVTLVGYGSECWLVGGVVSNSSPTVTFNAFCSTPPPTPSPTTPAPTTTLTQITLGVGTQSTSACNMSDTNFYWINDTQFANATKIYNTSAGNTVPTSQWYSDGTIAVQWQANGSFTDGSILNTIACTTPPPVAPQCYEYNCTSDGGNTVTYGYTNCASGNPSSATIPMGDSATICARESSASQITMSPNTGTVTYTQLCSPSSPTPAPANPTLYSVDVSPNPGTCSTAATSTYWWADPDGYLTGTSEAKYIAPSGSQVYSTSNYGNYYNTAGWYAVTQPGTGDDTLQYIGNTGIVGNWNYCPYTPPSPTPAPTVTSYEWGITMAEGEGDGTSTTACGNTLGFDDVYTAESSLTTATVLYTDPNLQYVFDGSPNGGFFGNWYGLGGLSDVYPSYAFWIDNNGDMLNRTSCSPAPTPSPVAPSPVAPPPITPSPIATPSPISTPPPVTPSPISTPSPVAPTPPPITPSPVAPQSYFAYGCEGGTYYLDYDGNLNTGTVVKFSGICATIMGTTTTSPTYYSYQEFSNCGECIPPPAPTPSPVAPTPSPIATPSPVTTPAPTASQCFRLILTQSSSSYPGTYTYKCCDGTWKYNQTLYGQTMVCSGLTGLTSSSNVNSQIIGTCSSGC